MITGQQANDVQLVLNALNTEHVNLAVAEHLPQEFAYGSLPLALTDAIFSIGLRYDEQCIPVVRAFAAWLDVPLASGGRSVGVAEALARLDALPEDEIIGAFGGKRYRTSTTNGILKADAVRQALRVLASHGINDFTDVRYDNPAVAAAESDFKRITGQGTLKSWSYFLMLAGDEEGVKPDRRILTFVARALGRQTVTDVIAVESIREASRALRARHPWITPRRLEYAIWDYERNR